MDTSKENIKMCEMAVEIQKEHKKELGDFIVSLSQLHVRVGFDEKTTTYLKHLRFMRSYGSSKIWLPRQDQLQEMIKIIGEEVRTCADHERLDSFHLFVFPKRGSGVMPHKKEFEAIAKQEAYVTQFHSMEQLWLAFVMKEKYQKTWNGERWSDD